MTNVINLYSGIGVVIDESVFETNNTPNRIQKIIDSLSSKNIPILKYSELPTLEVAEHFHSVNFIILDWNLSEIQPIPQGVIDNNIEFIKKTQSTTFIPIFIFSDENIEDIIDVLEENDLYNKSKSNAIFVKSKNDIESADNLFEEIEAWTRRNPSIYILKEWEKAKREAKTEMLWDLFNSHPFWPNILVKTFDSDGVDSNVEFMRLIQNSLSARINIPTLDTDIIKSEITDISKEELRTLLENERIVKNCLPDYPQVGDIYKENDIYYLNIRPDCDIIRAKNELYLIKGEILDETRINSGENNSVTFSMGELQEKINNTYVSFIEGKIIEFKFRKFEVRKWVGVKSNRIGRLLPPYITKIQQKFTFYIQRQGLPALPDSII